jgi:hypothetical protein
MLCTPTAGENPGKEKVLKAVDEEGKEVCNMYTEQGT